MARDYDESGKLTDKAIPLYVPVFTLKELNKFYMIDPQDLGAFKAYQNLLRAKIKE